MRPLFAYLLGFISVAVSKTYSEEEIQNLSDSNLRLLLSRAGGSECEACKKRHEFLSAAMKLAGKDLPDFQDVLSREQDFAPKEGKSTEEKEDVEADAGSLDFTDEQSPEDGSSFKVVDIPVEVPDSAEQINENDGLDQESSVETVAFTKDQEIKDHAQPASDSGPAFDANMHHMKNSENTEQGPRDFSATMSEYIKIGSVLGAKYSNLLFVNSQHYGKILWKALLDGGDIALEKFQIYGDSLLKHGNYYGKVIIVKAKKFGLYSYKKSIKAKDYAIHLYSTYTAKSTNDPQN